MSHHPAAYAARLANAIMSTTIQPASVAPPRKRWRKRWIALGLLLVAIGVSSAVFTHLYTAGERDVAAALAETDALDPSWRWDDILARRAVVADADNASLQVIKAHNASGKIYDQFRKHFGPDGDPHLNELAPDAPLGAEQIASLRALMADSRKALAESRKLKAMPKGRMPLTYA